jgi:hypothetical protein
MVGEVQECGDSLKFFKYSFMPQWPICSIRVKGEFIGKKQSALKWISPQRKFNIKKELIR